MAKILFIGDIVGRPGREFVEEQIPQLRKSLNLDLVIANGENAAGGSGITKGIATELQAAQVDAITLGDHVWDQRGFAQDINSLDFVCRPVNLPQGCPGRTHIILDLKGYRVAVFTVLGRTFMNKLAASCPFLACDAMLELLEGKAEAFIVEIHAEATAEKIALARYLDGRVAMVVGTHTHVPTADAEILTRGTAYMTDLGMSGPYDSVLGVQTQIIVAKLLDGMPRRYEIATEDVRICGALLDLDTTSGLAKAFEPFCLKQNSLTPSNG